MLLPQLPEFFAEAWKSLRLFVQIFVIDKFAAIERSVYELRATLVDVIYVRLRTMLQTAASFVDVASFIILSQANFWLDFMDVLGARLLFDFSRIGDDLMKYVRALVAWIQDKFLVSWSRILNFNLTPIIMAIVGGVAGAILSVVKPLPPITLLDLMQGTARVILREFIDTIAGLASLSPVAMLFDIPTRLSALGRAVDILLSPIGPRKASPPLPIVPKAFPSIFDMWFKSASAATLQKTLGDLAANVPGELSDIIDAAAMAVEQASSRFDDMAAAAAHAGSLTEFMTVASRAAEQAEQLFGPEARELRKRVAAGTTDVVASTFESWLATGGFFTVGSVLEQYVFQMLETFRKQEEKGEDVTVIITKTSPQILAKKAALARARMKEMTLDARGRRLDDGLVAEIASFFRSAVQDAYLTGRQVIRTAAEAATV
jgi:hypothetical protein